MDERSNLATILSQPNLRAPSGNSSTFEINIHGWIKWMFLLDEWKWTALTCRLLKNSMGNYLFKECSILPYFVGHLLTRRFIIGGKSQQCPLDAPATRLHMFGTCSEVVAIRKVLDYHWSLRGIRHRGYHNHNHHHIHNHNHNHNIFWDFDLVRTEHLFCLYYHSTSFAFITRAPLLPSTIIALILPLPPQNQLNHASE